MSKMPIYFNPAQLDFQPRYEWVLGKRISHPETTKRAQNIFNALRRNTKQFEILETPSIPLSAIRQSHNYQLMTVYNTAHQLPEGETFHPCVFPQRRSARPDPTNLNHSGFYCFDSGTPLSRNTWTAAAWSAASAYHAAKHVAQGKANVAYALSRPPGHHATREAFGGYCYFNNACIAARFLKRKGRVAILDVDFHHGNGNQEMFYDDNRVLTISLHGHPKKYFPYFAGFPDEIGIRKGVGFNLNVVLPDQTDIEQYLLALENHALPAILKFEPDYLIISAGFDTYVHDPIGAFSLNTEDYKVMADRLNQLGLPTVIVQEGGYFTRDLGKNVVSFLSGFFKN